MRSPLRRPIATLVAVTITWIVAEVVVSATLIEDGHYRDIPLPPFGKLDDKTVARLEATLARAARDGEDAIARGFDADLGWCNELGAHKTGTETGWINHLGARGPEELPSLAPVTLACFGDSFTFGSEVADNATWASQLHAKDERIHTLNFGVGGYGTDQALLRYRRDGVKTNPNIVVVGLMLENIGRNMSRFRRLYMPREGGVIVKPRFVLNDGALQLVPQPYATRSAMYRAALDGSLQRDLAPNDYWAGDDPLIAWSPIARVLKQQSAMERRYHEALWSDPEGEPYRVTFAILEAFKAEALANGAEHFLVVLYPCRRDTKRFRHGRPAWFTDLMAAMEARGLEALDLSVPMLEAPEGTPLFLKHHPTSEMHELFADAVLAWIRERVPVLKQD
jgi:lysophospholipase L1-like esterase